MVPYQDQIVPSSSNSTILLLGITFFCEWHGPGHVEIFVVICHILVITKNDSYRT